MESPDNEGRYLSNIIGQSDDWWEVCHSMIQWVFPLKEASNFNPNAPLLTDEDIDIFKSDSDCQKNLKCVFARFMRFLGLAWDSEVVIISPDFYKKKDLFLKFNHNCLRITRALKSMKLLGLEKECNAFYEFLKLLNDFRNSPLDNPFQYWTEAVS